MTTTGCPGDRGRYVGADGDRPRGSPSGCLHCGPATETETLISAGTVAEALIVSTRRGVGAEVAGLIDGLGFTIVAVTRASALRIAQAHQRSGKGVHPAGLNFADCFSYEVAKENSCPLLFVGDDFSKTDVEGCL